MKLGPFTYVALLTAFIIAIAGLSQIIDKPLSAGFQNTTLAACQQKLSVASECFKDNEWNPCGTVPKADFEYRYGMYCVSETAPIICPQVLPTGRAWCGPRP